MEPEASLSGLLISIFPSFLIELQALARPQENTACPASFTAGEDQATLASEM